MQEITNLTYTYGDADSGKMFLSAQVAGEVENFFLDTGSPETFLHKDRWQHSVVVEKSPYYSASGNSVNFDYIDVQEISIAGIKKQNFRVGLFPDYSEPQKLGLNTFLDESVKFDFPNKTIFKDSFFDLKHSFSIGTKGHLMFSAFVGKLEASCIFDTGAGLTVIDFSIVEQNPESFELIDDDCTTGDGNGEKIKAGLYKALRLKIGDVEFFNTQVGAMDLTPFSSNLNLTRPLIILGFNHIVSKCWEFDFKNTKFNIS